MILPLLATAAIATFAMAQSDSPDSPDYQYTPPQADTAPAPDGSMDEGADLIGRGMDMLFRNLLNEMAPQIDDMSRGMGEALSRLGPAMSDLSVLVDDIHNYQAPERLENGDIIIRRKPGALPPPDMGEGLRRFTQPGPDDGTPGRPAVPVDPDQPQIEL